MTLEKLLTPDILVTISTQASCNAKAQFSDEFWKMMVFPKLPPGFPPEILETLKEVSECFFEAGAESGSYEATEIFLRELLEALKDRLK